MEKPTSVNLDLPQSASPVLPRSWAHSNNPKPATKHEAAPRMTIVYASPPSLANAPREQGRALGEAFATLSASAQDIDRSELMASAVDAGFHNAARRDDYERALMNDEAALINMGFWGRSEED
jgi:hypothetical protein